ncbi:MAG: hypothetical protein R6V19_12105 [Armatimonadota bacterium]
MKRYIWLAALAVGLAGIIVGLSQGRWAVVYGWGQSLCASCVGLGG